MGALARALRGATNAAAAPLLVSRWQSGKAELPSNSFEVYAREGYSKNELVYACIEELATSAAEPRMHAKVGGQWTTEHPVVELLNRPNPFMDGFEFWATVIMHRSLAGNAFALKVRSASQRVVELWLLRPDRVRVVPDRGRFIARYEYDAGDGDLYQLPVEDVIHWKTRNPLSEFYGMPPLMAAAGRVDLDNYMKDFVKSYFTNAGVPAGMLTTKTALTPAQKEAIRQRFSGDFGGAKGWHGLMILEGAEASFTALTAELGPSGLVVPNLDEISEARIAMVFGVPLTIIGARLGVSSSSYANKRSDRESFWDEHLAPLYKEMSGPLNSRPKDVRRVGLTADFPGVQEVAFDLSDVRALQEDQDKIHARYRANLQAGGMTMEEFREKTGLAAEVPSAGTFLIPSNMVAVPAADVRAGRVGLAPEEPVESAPAVGG